MHSSLLSRGLATLVVLIGGCAPRSSATLPAPLPPGIPTDTVATADARVLRLTPGRFRYRLTQHTRIHAEPSTDTTTNVISVAARLLVDVSSLSDSTYDLRISIDSAETTTQGLIPSRVSEQHVSLGHVLQATLTPSKTIVTTQLPDSLCAYSHLVAAARDVLLPQLPARPSFDRNQPRADTTSSILCRAGSRIEVLSTREVRDSRVAMPEVVLTLRGHTELRGGGTLGRDSVAISGSISSSGTAAFLGWSRLPSLVKTQSDALITVRLGDSTTVFRQVSVQEIRQDQTAEPN
jgi:hypothetical protein